MTTQPEALRLADLLAEYLGADHPAVRAISAELRRLHAENDRLHQINQSHEMKLSVRGYEIQIADLVAQRDVLLEALQRLCSKQPRTSQQIDADWDNARAAIKAVEENT